ncbi:unnamed protein product, partial [Trichobilharzia regenti]
NANSGPNYPNSYPSDQSSFTNSGADPYGGQAGPDRSSRPNIHQNQGASFGGGYGTSDSEKAGERPNTEGSGLYPSGASRYPDSRSASGMPPAPRQSRFDTKPEGSALPQSNAYPEYGVGSNYASGYTSGFSNANQKAGSLQTSNPPSGPRSGRSRFDVGPPAAQPVPPVTAVQTTSANTYNQPTQSQSTSRSQPQAQQGAASTQAQPQSYGYGYSHQTGKPDAGSNTTAPQPVSQSYSAYNYGYGYGAYGSQTGPTSASVPRSSAPATGSTQSLYASAVAEKPQTTQQTNTSIASSAVSSATTTSASSDQSATAAAYASYYYGTSQNVPVSTQGSGKYDAAMAAAQQFNAWQQQQTPSAVSGSVSSSVPSAPTATVTPQTQTSNPYASYYAGYSSYPSSYGNMPLGGAPGTVPTATAPAAPTMSQYYAGYR